MKDYYVSKVIITGGAGLIGSALAKSLAGDGHQVILLSRNPQSYLRGSSTDIRLAAWDAHTPAGWGEWVEEAQAIVNLAGENLAAGRWTDQRKRRILASRVNAGQAVQAAVSAASHKPQVVIQSSAIGYYGPHGDELLTETDPPGTDFQSQVCLEWERSTAGVEALGVRRAVIRTAVVLSQDGGVLPRLRLPMQLFAGGPLGSGRQPFSWIHMDDEVAAIRFLIENPQASGVYNLSAPSPVSHAQFVQALGRAMGRPAWLPVPSFAVQMMFGEMAAVILEGQRVLPSRLQAAGFQFQFANIDQALNNLLTRRV